MTLRTITFDDEQWQVVPKVATERMILELMAVGLRNAEYANEGPAVREMAQGYAFMLAAAPEPPAQQPINQCDGCRRGLPVNERGIHRGEGYDLIACTAHLYRAPAPQPIADDADPDAIVAPLPVPEVGEERQAMIDQLRDQAIELDMLREALGVPYEPHQSLLERMLERAKSLRSEAERACTHLLMCHRFYQRIAPPMCDGVDAEGSPSQSRELREFVSMLERRADAAMLREVAR